MEKHTKPSSGAIPIDATSTTPVALTVSPIEGNQKGFPKRFFDSFRRDLFQAAQIRAKADDLSVSSFDIESAIENTVKSPLARKLKNRHLQMIAIGGAIGSGLFVGSGKALAAGGPGSLLIGYSLVSIMLYCTVYALGELSVLYPVAGSFSAFATRFLDPAWGFAMGWNYALQWMVTLPLEIVAATITINYWNSSVSPAVFVTIFLVLIVAINMFGVRGYGEAEFVFSIVKVIAVISFIILGIAIDCGAGPTGHYHGGKYFVNPGSFYAGFKGLCSIFVTAAFSFSGTELVGLCAAETADPRKSLPTAVKQVFWRIALFYMVSLTIVGLIVPYTNAELLTGGSATATASPFVIAITEAGIPALPTIMNVVILIAVLSVGNASIYGSSRTLAALAEQHQAPQFFAYIDRTGRPLVSILISSAFGLLAYTAVSDQEATIFNWLLAISGLSSLFTWLTICLCHIRFRAAWKFHGHVLSELAFQSQPGVMGSWFGFILNSLVFVAQFWVGFAPEGYGSMSVDARIINFFEVYLAAPIIVISYAVYKVWFRTHWVNLSDIDITTGVRDLDLKEILIMERAEKKTWPWYKKFYHFMC